MEECTDSWIKCILVSELTRYVLRIYVCRSRLEVHHYRNPPCMIRTFFSRFLSPLRGCADNAQGCLKWQFFPTRQSKCSTVVCYLIHAYEFWSTLGHKKSVFWGKIRELSAELWYILKSACHFAFRCLKIPRPDCLRVVRSVRCVSDTPICLNLLLPIDLLFSEWDADHTSLRRYIKENSTPLKIPCGLYMGTNCTWGIVVIVGTSVLLCPLFLCQSLPFLMLFVFPFIYMTLMVFCCISFHLLGSKLMCVISLSEGICYYVMLSFCDQTYLLRHFQCHHKSGFLVTLGKCVFIKFSFSLYPMLLKSLEMSWFPSECLKSYRKAQMQQLSNHVMMKWTIAWSGPFGAWSFSWKFALMLMFYR